MIFPTDRGLALVSGFFRWWFAELTSLVPERVRQLSQQRGRTVLVLGGAEAALLGLETPSKFTPLGEIADLTGPDAADKIQAILAKAQLGGRQMRVCLRLEARAALCQTIDLPLAAESNLFEVVGYELDRYTPFRAEQVYYAHRVVRRDAAAQRIAVEVTLVPKPTVDEALTVVRRLGLTAERVDVVNPAVDDGHSGNLLPRATGAERGAANRLTHWLAAAAIVLATMAVALPFAATQRKAAAMTEEFAGLRDRLQISEKLQKQLQTMHEEQGFLADRKAQTPTVSALLLETTGILPDDTWLTEFRVDGAGVEIAGVTASASALIGMLEQSGVFRNTSFRSPITSDPATGRERFSIAAQIIEKHPP
jgi:general secretion pathway protein L